MSLTFKKIALETCSFYYCESFITIFFCQSIFTIFTKFLLHTRGFNFSLETFSSWLLGSSSLFYKSVVLNFGWLCTTPWDSDIKFDWKTAVLFDTTSPPPKTQGAPDQRIYLRSISLHFVICLFFLLWSLFQFSIRFSLPFLLFRKVDIPGGSTHRNPMLVEHFRYHIPYFRVIWIKVKHIADHIGQAFIGKSLEKISNIVLKNKGF